MPLNKEKFQSDLGKIFEDMEPIIQEDLKKRLENPNPVDSENPGANSLYQVFEEIHDWTVVNLKNSNDKQKIWRFHAEKWGEGLSRSISHELTEKLISEFAPKFATLVTDYIKSSTIVIPPGQAVTGATSGGTAVVAATADPSKPGEIS